MNKTPDQILKAARKMAINDGHDGTSIDAAVADMLADDCARLRAQLEYEQQKKSERKSKVFAVIHTIDSGYDFELVYGDSIFEYLDTVGYGYVVPVAIDAFADNLFYTCFVNAMPSLAFPYVGMFDIRKKGDEYYLWGDNLAWVKGVTGVHEGFDYEEYQEIIEKGLDPFKELTSHKMINWITKD